MERPEHNQFGYTYVVNDDSDLTPPNDQLESMNVYLLDQQLVSLMESVLDGADTTFYANNQDTADHYFSGPVYPQCAIDTLGYPGEQTTGGAFDATFNQPPAAGGAQGNN